MFFCVYGSTFVDVIVNLKPINFPGLHEYLHVNHFHKHKPIDDRVESSSERIYFVRKFQFYSSHKSVVFSRKEKLHFKSFKLKNKKPNDKVLARKRHISYNIMLTMHI